MRRTTSINLHAPLDLQRIAAGLVATVGTESLLDSLEELLASGGALPARLYLYDRRASVYYAVAGFDCPRDATEIMQPDDLHPFPDHQIVLRCDGADVGLLEVLATAEWQRDRIGQLAEILAPALVAVDRMDRAHRELQHLRQEVAQLTGAGELLRHLDLDVLLTKVLEAAMSAVRAEVGALVAIEDGRITRRVSWGLRDDHVDALKDRAGERIIDAVFADGRTRCLDAEGVRQKLDLAALDGKLSGLLALPVVAADRTHGVMLLGNPEGTFGEGERRLAETVCGMAGIAIDNALLVRATVDRERLRREMDLARSVQESMWPTPRLALARLDVAGASRPCNETGGDYYTYVERGGRLIAGIADVSGHGLGAALHTTTAHAVLHQQLRMGASPGDAMRILNESLWHAHSGRFMTAALIDIDPATLALRYVSAGHNPLLLVRGATTTWLPSVAIPLGIELAFACGQPPDLQLQPGDLLLLYTDGVTEAFDPQDRCFGAERLAELVVGYARQGLAPTAVVEAVFAAVEGWAAGVPWHDDLTLVAIAVGPGPA